MKIKKLNNDIAILKFIFTLVIVWFHSDTVVPHHPYLFFKGNLGVEFFFILSGYFMASSIVRNQSKGIEQNAFEFTLHKIKLIFPQLIAAYIIAFSIRNFALQEVPLKDIFTLSFFSLGEVFFINITGLKMSRNLYNGPTWYISAMMVTIFLLYPIVKKNVKKFGCYWGVLIPLFLYAYFISIRHTSLANARAWINFTTGGMIRAIAGISLGITLYVASEAIKNKYEITKFGNSLIRTIAFILLALLFSFIGTSYFSQFKVVTDLNFVAYSFIFLLTILITETKWSFVDSKTVKFLSAISLPIYLNHYSCICFIQKHLIHLSSDKKIGLVILFTLITSTLTLLLAKIITKSFKYIFTFCFQEKQRVGGELTINK